MSIQTLKKEIMKLAKNLKKIQQEKILLYPKKFIIRCLNCGLVIDHIGFCDLACKVEYEKPLQIKKISYFI